jgi:aminopeptidase
MKKRNTALSILFLGLLICTAGTVRAQDEAAYKQLAKRLVQSASVKPGDVVVIDGGKHMIPLMESIAIEVQMIGGMPVMFLESDRVTRSMYTEVPDKYLEQVPKFFGEWYKNANVFIGLPSFEDNKALIAGVSDERFAKFSKTSDYFAGILNSLPVRVVGIDFPTKLDAENAGIDFATYQKLTSDGINTDYETLSGKGEKLQQMLKSAKSVRITSPAGTDFTFSLAPGRSVFLDDGIVTADEAKSKVFTERVVNLPGGNVFFAPLETSASGKVVVPRMRCRYKDMDNVSFEFKNGRMESFNAATNAECFQEALKPYTGPKDMFGNVWIGLNPALKVIEEGKANYRPFNAAGMVYVGIGENRQYGGNNNSNSGSNFPITNATVTVDGKMVIKDGKLVF